MVQCRRMFKEAALLRRLFYLIKLDFDLFFSYIDVINQEVETLVYFSGIRCFQPVSSV